MQRQQADGEVEGDGRCWDGWGVGGVLGEAVLVLVLPLALVLLLVLELVLVLSEDGLRHFLHGGRDATRSQGTELVGNMMFWVERVLWGRRPCGRMER